MKEEICLKRNQFGGVKGSSVDHLLCNIWHEIGSNLEDSRAATVITAIDYAKAFNRLCYKSCLSSLARKGASSQVIRLVATFLTNRTMSVRVEKDWSEPLPVTGGVPQGSLIGVFLFNMATDDLETGPDVHDADALAVLQEESEGGSTDPPSEEDDSPSDVGPLSSTPVANMGPA